MDTLFRGVLSSYIKSCHISLTLTSCIVNIVVTVRLLFVSEGYKQQGAAQYFIHSVPGTDGGGGVHPRQQHRHVPGLHHPVTLYTLMYTSDSASTAGRADEPWVESAGRVLTSSTLKSIQIFILFFLWVLLHNAVWHFPQPTGLWSSKSVQSRKLWTPKRKMRNHNWGIRDRNENRQKAANKSLIKHFTCMMLVLSKTLVSGTFQFFFILHLILVFPHKLLWSAHLVCPFRAPVHMRREHNAAALFFRALRVVNM